MAAKKNHKLMIKKLKKQVNLLQRKEEQSRNKLRAALKKLKKLGRSYKTKMAVKMRAMKGKLSSAKGSAYAKVAADIERKLIKGIESKSKAIASAISKIEKKHTSKFTKGVAKKAKVRKNKKRSTAGSRKTTRTSPPGKRKRA